MKYSIYYFFHPLDVYLGYVGHTNDPETRFLQHISEARAGLYNKLKCEWINAINEQELLMAITEKGTALSIAGILKREQYWMNIFRRDGFILLNMRDAYPDWGDITIDPEIYVEHERHSYKFFDDFNLKHHPFFKPVFDSRMGVPDG